jgi:hypothetical protein
VRKSGGILYFQDEANVSLTAFLGKTWGLRGRTPRVSVTGNRAGVAAMSAISKRGRLLFRLYDTRIRSPEVISFLDQMLAHHKRRHVVVVMDQAPPHTSQQTKRFVQTEPAASACLLSTQVLPGLEPGRKGMESLEAPRAQGPPGEDPT